MFAFCQLMMQTTLKQLSKHACQQPQPVLAGAQNVRDMLDMLKGSRTNDNDKIRNLILMSVVSPTSFEVSSATELAKTWGVARATIVKAVANRRALEQELDGTGGIFGLLSRQACGGRYRVQHATDAMIYGRSIIKA
jgi:hypothetical protein